jgi:hypothetical protein
MARAVRRTMLKLNDKCTRHVEFHNVVVGQERQIMASFSEKWRALRLPIADEIEANIANSLVIICL